MIDNVKGVSSELVELFESCPFCVYCVDIERRLVYANESFLSLYAMSLDELLGKTSNDFYSEAHASKYERDDLYVLENEAIFTTVEYNEDPRTGDVHMVEVVKLPRFDARGDLIGIWGVFWDITELVDDDATVLNYWNRLLKMNVVDDVLLINEHGEVLFGSKQTRGSFLDSVSEHERPQVRSHINRAFVDQTVELFSVSTTDTDQFFSCRLMPGVIGDMQKMAVLFVVDVTETVALQSSTERDVRLNLLTQYSAAMSHDLNNLFTVLMCNISLLEPKSEEDVELIDDILQATQKSQQLVSQMRRFVSPDTTSYDWVNVRAFLEEKSSLFERVLGRQTELELIWGPVEGEVYINASRFEHLLLMLLLNLKEHQQHPTRLSLEVVVPHEFPPLIQLHLMRASTELIAEPMTQITLDNQRTRDMRSLIFADHVMRLFGGSFQARASASNGMLFVLELPFSPTD